MISAYLSKIIFWDWPEDPSTINEEVVQQTQVEIRDELLSLLGHLDLEEAYVLSEFKGDLTKHHHVLEILSDWSKPRRPTPTYLWLF